MPRTVSTESVAPWLFLLLGLLLLVDPLPAPTPTHINFYVVRPLHHILPLSVDESTGDKGRKLVRQLSV